MARATNGKVAKADLTLRVAWHDSAWNGHVCKAPTDNAFCMVLERIRESRDDARENQLAGQSFSQLRPKQLPPCSMESGAFMNTEPWTRCFEHPYAPFPKLKDTHGHLRPTNVVVSPFATFAVPFGWMLRRAQDDIEKRLPDALPPDEEPPFGTPWVFGRERQKALNQAFFGRLVGGESLVFFYCKDGHPLGDTISRLIVGVGRITSVGKLNEYATENGKRPYPMWERVIGHSLRPQIDDGFLLPYGDYLKPTGDQTEDDRRRALLREIAVEPNRDHSRTFSYAAEHCEADVTVAVLTRCLASVRKIRSHGIAAGQWDRAEEWLNAQIAAAWRARGAFPGFGAALEAAGFRLGTALALDSLASGLLTPDDDPWPFIDGVFAGTASPPNDHYAHDIAAFSGHWRKLPQQRRDLLKLLSRFALTPKQSQRWFEPERRRDCVASPVSDAEILANPYRISETDLGDWDDLPVSMESIDRGLLPESHIAAKHPLPMATAVKSKIDPRRGRAALVSVLRRAASNGDSLLSQTEALSAVATLDLADACILGSDWPTGHADALAGVVDVVEITSRDDTAPAPALQLSEMRSMEERLRRILGGRASKEIAPPAADWEQLLVQAISDAGGRFDPANQRHTRALTEQAVALETILSRRLAVLVGRAGTGKTSVLGALLQCTEIAGDGILLLAPTGKARVRLGRATNADAMTVAQFLYSLGRFDATRQRPLLTGKEKYRKQKTVVIDESSMLTMDDLIAVLEALDLVHVQRVILVGDPNQLPPIGTGRPFADLVAFLESSPSSNGDDAASARTALARLTVEVRAIGDSAAASDTLRLASWFTREPQQVDADRILSGLELGTTFNDLQINFWKTAQDLHSELLSAFEEHLNLSGLRDIVGFNKSLGIDERGLVPFDSPDGSERWQILSPVRMQSYGVHDLNTWVQRTFRDAELEQAQNPWGLSLGDESIVWKDKVIQTRNQLREGYDHKNRQTVKEYIANGEVGAVTKVSNSLRVIFSGRPSKSFIYRASQFANGFAPLELAYTITVHKSQGSEFRKIFVIIPKNCRLLSRELMYTALTRSREQVVLFIEGDDPTVLYDLSKPERSETARRNTNLFQAAVRDVAGDQYAAHLIHRTEKGHLVRSKSELVISNMLYNMGIEYEYERVLEGSKQRGRLRPDFSFATPEGDVIIWEHLGMLNDPAYARGWDWKRNWYEENGFTLGRNLFVSKEDERGGLDATALKDIALAVKAQV